MAVITITEILGGDNIAGSRITINDNFKRLANAINTIETRLDTSFNPGGSLNVGNALIRRYTNPTSAQIFDCEATGLFQGNLNVLLDFGVTQSINAGLDLNVSRNITFDGAAVGGPHLFRTAIRTNFEHEIVNQQLFNGIPTALTINPQTLVGPSVAVRPIPSVIGHSVLRLDLSTYLAAPADNCDTIILPAVGGGGCTDGQTLTIIIDTPSVNLLTNFQIDASTLATASNIILGTIATPASSADIKKLAVTLYADNSGWRVLHTAAPSDGAVYITY